VQKHYTKLSAINFAGLFCESNKFVNGGIREVTQGLRYYKKANSQCQVVNRKSNDSLAETCA